MASTSSPTNSQYLKAGLGCAGNHLRSDLPPYAPYETPRKSSATSKFVSGIGGAGNFNCATGQASISSSESVRGKHLQRDNSPSNSRFGIDGNGSRASRPSSRSSSSFSKQPSPPPPPPVYALSPASSHTTMDGFDRLKARISSKIHANIAARNSRVSLFEAWQQKLPIYPAGRLRQTSSLSHLI